MKVLFVSSGTASGISPIVTNQGEALKKEGIEITYYQVSSGGLAGYAMHIVPLAKLAFQSKFDIIHAHYGLCAAISIPAAIFAKKLVVSFMGDDLLGEQDVAGRFTLKGRLLVGLNLLLLPFYNRIIVKSYPLFQKVWLKKRSAIIANGVSLEKFVPTDRLLARELLGWDTTGIVILFPSSPSRPEKNYPQLKQAIEIINKKAEIKHLENIPNNQLYLYYSAADVCVLTSFHEGSPNAIKEAMACSCPIVSTKVGDVEWILGQTEGCYLTEFDPNDTAEKISKALLFAAQKGRTKGRQQIISLGLDEKSVSQKIIRIYQPGKL